MYLKGFELQVVAQFVKMSTPMEVDPPAAAKTKTSTSNKDKPRFEVKKA